MSSGFEYRLSALVAQKRSAFSVGGANVQSVGGAAGAGLGSVGITQETFYIVKVKNNQFA